MKIGIVTDSTSDIPAYLAEQLEIIVVPTLLVIDGREYVDGTGITREEFYTRLPLFQTAPTTAAPSIGDFAKAYETLFSQGCDQIVSIHAASQLTNIINVTYQAAKDFSGRVTCLNSGSLSLGLGFQVIAAAESADLGLKAVLGVVESTRKRSQVTAALDTMEYLKRSGRIPNWVANLGGILSIKPIIELIGGEVKSIGAVRTTNQADKHIFDLLLKQGDLERLAVLHTNAEPRAKKLLDGMMSHARASAPRDILLVNVTAVIGTHLGPNGVGFAAVRKHP